ncbi:hypothetical protein U8607_20040 [Methylobacterium durans]|uniref:hypothetical protein n=1 Tax=Methylobacterium durans TaxID=2202825 RepID=UPI002AFE202C|nr:hypothetical protein [Methylobacterium durans]MEA1834387.1 hypothetical protein [Methylobacterium durans]
MDQQPTSRLDPDEAAAVEMALGTLIADGSVRLSERNRRFLSFIVTETLAGRGARIKAYAIGVDVFGRSRSFDPDRDPIVRIEATRMRAALAAYYDGVGAQDGVRIILRPGSYVPTFAFRRSPAALARPAAAIGATPVPAGRPVADERAGVIVVVTHRTDRRDRCSMVRGEIYVEAVVKAVAGRGIRVFLTPPVDRSGTAQAIRGLIHRPGVVYALDMAVHGIAEGRRYSWSLSDFRNGEIKDSDFCDQADETLPVGARIDALAEVVTRRIAASAV